MSLHLIWAQRLKKAGSVLGRDGLSKRAAAIMVELVTKTGSYKECMIAAGRLKAIAAAAKYDGYWTEKVDDGFHKEMHFLEDAAKKASALSPADRGGAAKPATDLRKVFSNAANTHRRPERNR